MVVDWEQDTGLLMTSGDVRVVRIWDTDREMKVQVLNTPAHIVTMNTAAGHHTESTCSVRVTLYNCLLAVCNKLLESQ